ncbi:replication factor-a protein [Jaminaea rosea]|uniref:Replication protein A subunit n=1 Tax=Jaminaea rosea TaxID=1569628 RepID=A0A316UYB1_9BASI|nr:replication factor-a protein [Jaminaea rosea]PWN30202.1 replication factor-a protein [Jaminaea rosea]
MTDVKLNAGAIDRMLRTTDSSEAVPPEEAVCQILSIKKIATSQPGAGDRYRVILSDGIHFAQAMLATQQKVLVESGQIDRNSVVRVTQYVANSVQQRRILILLGLEPLGAPLGERLGDPANWETAAANGGAGAAGGAANGGGSNGSTAGPAAANKAGGAAPSRTNSGNGGTKPLSRGPSMANGAPVYPIEGLSPYQNKWTIKARVTLKSDIKHWSNQRGEGKLFSVNLLDESGEIKATGFNDAVDRFYPLLQENKVYYISKARVNIAKKQFSNLNNEYEIAFENNTEIEECLDAADVPEVKYAFVQIDQLDGVEPNQTCDVIGIIDEIGDVAEIISKASQKPITKRELTLVDQSGMSVRLTLWGRTAEQFDQNLDKPVIAFKGVKVGDFGGRSLSMFSSSSMMVNPDIPEAHGLRGWYDSEGNQAAGNFKTFAGAGLGGLGAGGGAGGAAGSNKNERRTIAQAKEQGLGMSGDKPDYFNIRATVVYIKQEGLSYPACPSANCNKKVVMEDENSWRCEKCDTTYPAPQYRYILAANVADHTDGIWLSGFNEIGELLIGQTASELEAVKTESESNFVAALHRATNRSYMFNIRAKQDTFNDTTRVRYTVTKATPVDWSAAANELADDIKALM